MKSKKVTVSARKRRLIITALLATTLMTSCNVVRTITTESSSVQRGDTSVIIQTKTIEQYTANKM